ncbi:hypothetical protein GCM10027299_29090 [Larkinella ripae]
MISAIESASSLLDMNTVQRDLCTQFRKKSLGMADFLNAFHQLQARADECRLIYHGRYDTFAPLNENPGKLERMRQQAADFDTVEELQKQADLLRSGIHGLDDTDWQLTWAFLLARGADLGIFWNSETKLFK